MARAVVTKVNPRKKKRGAKKKAAKRKPAKKKAARKPAKKRSATKKNTRKKTATAKKTGAKTVARKRRRKKAPTRRRRRRTTRNPRSSYGLRSRASKKGWSIELGRPFKDAPANIIGKLWVSWAVRRFGDPVTAPFSETTGSAWNFKNYFIGALAAAFGGEMVGRFAKPSTGQKVYDGGIDLLLTKLVWSEGVQKWPSTAVAFGQGDDQQMRQLSAQAGEGDILDDGKGNRWLLQGGQWVAMMGTDSPYDPQALSGNPYTPEPLGGTLVAEDYLGGTLVAEDYLGGSMGHAMSPDTSRAYASASQFLDTGSPDPYSAAYQQ